MHFSRTDNWSLLLTKNLPFTVPSYFSFTSVDHHWCWGLMSFKDSHTDHSSFTKYLSRAYSVPRPVLGTMENSGTGRQRPALWARREGGREGSEWGSQVNIPLQGVSQTRGLFFLTGDLSFLIYRSYWSTWKQILHFLLTIKSFNFSARRCLQDCLPC